MRIQPMDGAVTLNGFEVGYGLAGMGEELGGGLPRPVRPAGIIATVDAVCNPFVPGTAAQAAHAATSVYDVRFAPAADKIRTGHASETGGQSVRTTGLAEHGDRTGAAVEPAIRIRVERIHITPIQNR